MATRTTSVISWRGFNLEGDEYDHWSKEYAEGYLGLSKDTDSSWSAVIECGQLVGEGDGHTAEAALEAACDELRGLLAEHGVILAKYFPESASG